MSVVFEDNFLLLPPKHREIWKVIWYFSKEYRNAFPSYKKIAQLAKCSIRTVATAINNFRNFGWLKTIKRCFRSCLYYVNEKLLFLNPKDRSIYKRKVKSYEQKGPTYEQGEGGVFRDNLHDKLHHIGVSYDCKDTIRSNVQQTRFFKNGKWLSIRPNIQELPFKLEDKIMIQMKFTEAEIALAAESFRSYKKTPQKPIALFWWLCKEAKRMFKHGR